MDRYSLIYTKMPREFVLLQGTGCRWGKCTTKKGEEPILSFYITPPLKRHFAKAKPLRQLSNRFFRGEQRV